MLRMTSVSQHTCDTYHIIPLATVCTRSEAEYHVTVLTYYVEVVQFHSKCKRRLYINISKIITVSSRMYQMTTIPIEQTCAKHVIHN